MLIMRDSGTEPWDDQEYRNNATGAAVFLALFQSFTKTSAMVSKGWGEGMVRMIRSD